VARLRTSARPRGRASAFQQTSGVALLLEDLRDALARGARVRLLTGDYLGISSPDALRSLLRLADEHQGFAPFFFETEGGQAFHPKSYRSFAARTAWRTWAAAT